MHNTIYGNTKYCITIYSNTTYSHFYSNSSIKIAHRAGGKRIVLICHRYLIHIFIKINFTCENTQSDFPYPIRQQKTYIILQPCKEYSIYPKHLLRRSFLSRFHFPLFQKCPIKSPHDETRIVIECTGRYY